MESSYTTNMLILAIVGGKIRWFESDELPSSVIWPLYYPGEEQSFCSGLIIKFKLLKQELFHLCEFLDKLEQESDKLEDDRYYKIRRFMDIREMKLNCARYLPICSEAIRELKDNPSMHQILEYQNWYRDIGHKLTELDCV